MSSIQRIFVVLLFLVCFTFYFPRDTLSYFSDDFTGNTLNTEVWQAYSNSGQILVSDNKLSLLRSPLPSKSFPYIFSKVNIFPETGPFSIKIGYKYLSTGNFGDGITLSTDKAPANGVDPGSDILGFITFSLWQTMPDGLYFQKILCNGDGTKCNQLEFLNNFTHVSDFNPHEVRIDYSINGQYLIYLDGNSTPVFVSGINQKRPTKIWMGNPLAANTADYWSSFEVDYIHVGAITSRGEVVVVPGFGGSWDVGAILSGETGSNWKIPPFIKNYEGIIQSLKNAGYEENKDLFVFGYDWRKPLNNLADDLNTFINNKNLTKVNLIGHSMGGLVARSYAQKYSTSKVVKILTAGSPHMGVVDAYGIWEGAKIWDGAWWQNALLEIATEVHRNPGETKVASVRRNTPSIIDLFPTFPFLNYNGSLKTIASMAQKNNFLASLNDNASVLGDKLTPFWSDDIGQTKNIINVVDRESDDTVQNRWEDGKPVPTDTFGVTAGDGTVTKVSAVGPFGVGEKMAGWHGDLLANLENNKKILTKLGLDPNFASASATTDNRKNSFVALLRSPGTLEICNANLTLCNENLGGIYLPENKLFILPGYNQEDLVVKVKEMGLGNYELYLGNIDESPDWQVRSGVLQSEGQEDTYDVKSSEGNIIVLQDNIIDFKPLADKVYGDPDFSVEASASSGLLVTFNATGNCTISENMVHLTSTGNCTITATQNGNDHYRPADNVSRSFVIDKTILTVTADNKTREYSDPDPVFTYTVSKLDGFTGTPSCSTTATRFSPAGEYPIVCSQGTLSSDNYNFNFVDGVLKVEKEKVKINYTGNKIVFLGGKKKVTANIQLRAKLVQENDWHPGKLELAKVDFELVPVRGNGSNIVAEDVSVDRKGTAKIDLPVSTPGEYWVNIKVDPTNPYWSGQTTKLKKIRIVGWR